MTRRLHSCEPTTIHTLRGAPLSWCGKFGLSPEVRLLLGHYSSEKHSADTYARDVLAQPLREYEQILRQIRAGAFRPDSSRSGLMGDAVSSDPIKTRRLSNLWNRIFQNHRLIAANRRPVRNQTQEGRCVARSRKLPRMIIMIV